MTQRVWSFEKEFQEPKKFAKEIQRLMKGFADEILQDIQGNKEDVKTAPSPGGPDADVFEDAEAVRVLVDLPGMKQEDLELSYDKGSLFVEGTRRPPFTPEQAKRLRGETLYGRFRKEVRIGPKITPDGIDATLKDGVLEIVLPKEEKDKPIKINVKG